VEKPKSFAGPYGADQQNKSHALPEGNIIQGKTNYGMLGNRFFHAVILAERDENAMRV